MRKEKWKCGTFGVELFYFVFKLNIVLPGVLSKYLLDRIGTYLLYTLYLVDRGRLGDATLIPRDVRLSASNSTTSPLRTQKNMKKNAPLKQKVRQLKYVS